MQAPATRQQKFALLSPFPGEHDDTCRAHYWSNAWQDQAGEFCANGVTAGGENRQCCHEHHNELAGQLPCWCRSSAECCTDKVSKSCEVALGFWVDRMLGSVPWFFSLQMLVLSGTQCWCSKPSHTLVVKGNAASTVSNWWKNGSACRRRGTWSDLWLLLRCQVCAVQLRNVGHCLERGRGTWASASNSEMS